MPSQIQLEIRQIDSIESSFLRDLIWLIYSQNIESEKIPQELNIELIQNNRFTTLWKWYETIINKQAETSNPRMPLGKYAEELFLYFFKRLDSLNFIDHSIQLIDNKITLGEIDYLFRMGNEAIHLELAIKYYLHTTYNGKKVYLGPSTNDWFERKMTKLKEHQLQLTSKYRHLLPIELQNTSFKPKLIIKGSLFNPFSEKGQFNTSNKGWWLHIEDVNQLDSEHSYTIITEKRNWIFPFNSRLKRYSLRELKQLGTELLISRNEIMVARLDEDGYAIDRGFVVRKDWPN